MGGVGTDYTQDVGAPLSQVLQARQGSTTTNYLYGLDRLGALTGSTRMEELHDTLGSTRLTTDVAGNTQSALRFDPYGRPIGSTQLQPCGFTGEMQNGTSELVHLRARWYQPQLGVFISKDPFTGNASQPQSLHPYAYAQNSPTRYTDPSGRCIGFLGGADTLLCAAIIGAAVGGLIGAGIEYGSQVYANYRSGVRGWGMWTQVCADEIFIGAMSGALAGATGALLGPAMAALSKTGLLGSIIAGATEGELTAGAAHIVANVLRGRQWDANLGSALVSGYVVGGAGGGLGWAWKQWRTGAAEASGVAGRYADDATSVRRAATDCSFTPDTPVATKDGEKAIGAVNVGDTVRAYDERTGETASFTVTAVLVHNDPVIEHLTITGEQLTTTPEHPFYVQGQGWIPASELRVGDQVRKADGNSGAVEAVRFEARTQTMYNLTVAIAHTFFVGKGRWLVHNTCGDLYGDHSVPGHIDYGTIDSVTGYRSGTRARITKDMVGGPRSDADPAIFPPGFPPAGSGPHIFARGHLHGSQLGGSGELPQNLVTLIQNPANSPVMRRFEGRIRSAVEDGEVVYYYVKPIYSGVPNTMPLGVTLRARGSNGFRLGVTVLNR